MIFPFVPDFTPLLAISFRTNATDKPVLACQNAITDAFVLHLEDVIPSLRRGRRKFVTNKVDFLCSVSCLTVSGAVFLPITWFVASEQKNHKDSVNKVVY